MTKTSVLDTTMIGEGNRNRMEGGGGKGEGRMVGGRTQCAMV